MILKFLKIFSILFSLIFLSGCLQSTALLGPSMTVATTGNVLQAGLQYGANTAIKNGPVNALDAALREALETRYPALGKLRLTDFKVRVLETSKGTGAITRVLLDTTNGEQTWTTIGVSENIIEASWQALVDSIVYGLMNTEE